MALSRTDLLLLGIIIIQGTGLVLQQCSHTPLSRHVAGLGVLHFPSILDGTCTSLDFPVAGVAARDYINPLWPSTLESGLLGTMNASANNIVTVQLCNLSGATIDPALQTFGASVGFSW